MAAPAPARTGRPVPCPRCDAPSAPGSRFCEACGAPMADNTTRYLCAAVHTDAEFCHEALDEFTVEPVRAVPHTPGLDTAAVLRDALAARHRRRLRDGLLFALLLVALVASPVPFAWWLGLAALLTLLLDLGRPQRPVGASLGTAALNLLVAGVVLAAGTSVSLYARYAGVDLRPGFVVAAVAVLAMAAVLAWDAFAVHWLVQHCFGRRAFRPDPRMRAGQRDPLPRDARERERRLRTFGVTRLPAVVGRIEQSDHGASGPGRVPLVLHRGFAPFVGAGTIQTHVGFATPLQRRDDSDEYADTDGATVGPPVEVEEIHRRIARALSELRTSSSLGPGGRLADIRIDPLVFASADDLAEHSASALAHTILPDPQRPPVPSLPEPMADALATDPAEWVRYYRCARVETWERDLVVSTFVHLGADERNFYLERVRYVLPPLKPRFRDIDVPVSGARPLGRALLALVTLPASVVRRARSFFPARPLRQRPGVLVPDRYGAGRSLREIAADTECRTYFQSADVFRYGEIVDRAVLRAVGAYLDELGYSAVEFQEQFAQNINDFRGAQITQSAVGTAATVAVGPGPDTKRKTP